MNETSDSTVREMDTVSRFGGDEFVVLLTELDANFEIARSQAAIVAEKMRDSLSNPYMLEIGKDVERIRSTIEHASSASIGVFVYLGNGDTIINLLKWSDAAMYLAKCAHPPKFGHFVKLHQPEVLWMTGFPLDINHLAYQRHPSFAVPA